MPLFWDLFDLKIRPFLKKASKSLLVFVVFHLISHFAWSAERHLYYMGGGEKFSQNPQATHFDYSFFYVRQLEKQGWQAQYLFAAEQENSKRLRNEVEPRAQSFTIENLHAMFRTIEKDLKSGALTNGRLLIYFDTHGELDDDRYYIKATDGRMNVLPTLKRIKKLATKSKAQIGIIGATCFSGQLLVLADENTCVLTTTPEDTVGLIMNNNAIAYLLSQKAADNLEELHLKSRHYKDIDLGQPLLSTLASRRTFEVLKELRSTMLVAGQKSALEFFGGDPLGIEKTWKKLESIGLAMPLAEQIEKLKKLDQKWQDLLKNHKHEIAGLLAQTCHKPSDDPRMMQICAEASSGQTPEAPSQATGLNPQEAAKIMKNLSQTTSEIGDLERELYDFLYQKFSREVPASVCSRFKLR